MLVCLQRAGRLVLHPAVLHAALLHAGRALGLLVPWHAASPARCCRPCHPVRRVAPSDRHQAAVLARLAHGAGARSLAIAHDTATYGYGLSLNIIAAFTKLPGGHIAATADIAAAGGPAAAAQQLAATSLRPDALLVATNNVSLAAAFLLAAQGQAGLAALPTYVGDGLADPAFGKAVLAGDRAAGAAVLGRLHATQLTPGSAAFHAELRAFTNGSVPYRVAAAHAYDAAGALLRAFAEAAPPKGRPQVRAALQATHFAGATGPVAFDASDDLAVSADNEACEYAVMGFDPASGKLRGVDGGGGARRLLLH